MRGKNLSILTVVLTLTIVHPSVYAGSQEPPTGPAPGPPKAPVEKPKPPQSDPSEPSGQKRIFEPPFDLSREFPVTKRPKPSEAKPDAKSDEKDRKALKKRQDKEHPSSNASPPEPNLSGPIGKLPQPNDSDPKSKSSSETPPAENADLRQERESKNLPGLPVLEPNPRIAAANPSGETPNKKPQGREPSAKAKTDRVASAGKASSQHSLSDSGRKTADPGREPNPSAEMAAASSQTDRQLPRTEETPMPKTASHGPLLMIVGLLTAAFGWAGRKAASDKG